MTAYDAPFARLAEAAGVDAILVGDSLGPNVLGYDSEIRVSVADIVHHTAAVARAIRRPLLIADMPFMSYATPAEALRHAARMIQVGGAAAVKLEGGLAVAPITAALVEHGIPVMAHVGLTPQSIHTLGGYKVQGHDLAGAQRVVDGARAQAEAGAFGIVLEAVPVRLAERLTAVLPIPTIGIGAGPHCDGQIQVLYDLLGFRAERQPRHAKVFADVASTVEAALGGYVDEVRRATFPTEDHGFKLQRGVLDQLKFD
ncbi:MAG: 3-methyl-2-oxobutanoate hydroxymethyltransferase [Actinobacteria bacterium]|nr:3-methyl-2-oxobutanoate hydroxymethyltransferase [Actinomycetota bacterium]